MFDIGLLELFLVLVIGLVVLGPERLPEVIKSVTRAIKWIKKTVTSTKEKISKNIILKKEDLEKELFKEIQKVEREIQELRDNAPEKINKIAIETSTNLLQQLIGVDVNSSSVSAIVDDLSRKKMTEYYGN